MPSILFEGTMIQLGQTLVGQEKWSLKVFGPGERTEQILSHIESEIKEVRADPADCKEWIDIMSMAFDGAVRSGHSVDEVMRCWISKMLEVRTRKYIEVDGEVVRAR